MPLLAGLGFRRDRRAPPHVLCHFAAMWDSLDVAAPGDCSSAIKPKVEHRPIFLPAIPFLVEPNGWWASTVARFQEARRHSQGVAELGYVSFQYVRFMAAGFSVHPHSHWHRTRNLIVPPVRDAFKAAVKQFLELPHVGGASTASAESTHCGASILSCSWMSARMLNEDTTDLESRCSWTTSGDESFQTARSRSSSLCVCPRINSPRKRVDAASWSRGSLVPTHASGRPY